jgi:hypothetical protein
VSRDINVADCSICIYMPAAAVVCTPKILQNGHVFKLKEHLLHIQAALLQTCSGDTLALGSSLASVSKFVSTKLCKRLLTQAYLKQCFLRDDYAGTVLSMNPSLIGIAGYAIHTIDRPSSCPSVRALYILHICSSSKEHSSAPLRTCLRKVAVECRCSYVYLTAHFGKLVTFYESVGFCIWDIERHNSFKGVSARRGSREFEQAQIDTEPDNVCMVMKV